jgi:thioredoxin 1
MMTPIAVTDESFATTVLQAEQPVLLDFGADWCPPCKLLDPLLEELAEELADQLVIGKLDVDENPETPQSYGIMGLPTLLLFKGGQPVDRIVGFQPKGQLLRRVQAHLS